jgi:hypothetical protein
MLVTLLARTDEPVAAMANALPAVLRVASSSVKLVTLPEAVFFLEPETGAVWGTPKIEFNPFKLVSMANFASR